ncbi:MAG: glycosyltransferase [Thermoanaerobaculia bacterium]
MRIGQLIDSLSVGGAQSLQLMFAQAVQDRDVELTVATLYPSRVGELAAELESLGVRVVALHGRSLLDPLRARRLVRFLRRERFNVLFTHLSSANLLGPIAGRIAGVPTIATLHAISRPTLRTRETLETWALRRATTHCVAVGSAVAEAHRDRVAPASCVVIPNPVKEIPPLPRADRLAARRELIGTKQVMLVSTGRLKPVKGFADLLTAFAELRRTQPEAALVIAGSGPLEGELRAQILRLGLQGHAHLIGLCRDVPRLLAAADLYVNASHQEGMPMSVLEAMAAGLPVVATGVGDVRSIVVDGSGLLVPPREPHALAAALKRLLDNREQAAAMGTVARQYVRRNHRVDRWAERLLQLAAQVGRSTGSHLPSRKPLQGP